MWKRLRRWLPRSLFPLSFVFWALSTSITFTTNTYQSPAYDVARGLGIAAYIAVFLGMLTLRFSNEGRSNQ